MPKCDKGSVVKRGNFDRLNEIGKLVSWYLVVGSWCCDLDLGVL